MKKKLTGKRGLQPVIEGLQKVLANTYLLYLKTQNFHWNVTGDNFYSLHLLFEKQYQALAEAVDVIAERIRALSAPAPATFKEFLSLATLEEPKGKHSAKRMLSELLKDHTALSNQLAELFAVADSCGDEVTLDLFIQRKTEHDKTAWMLQSSIE